MSERVRPLAFQLPQAGGALHGSMVGSCNHAYTCLRTTIASPVTGQGNGSQFETSHETVGIRVLMNKKMKWEGRRRSNPLLLKLVVSAVVLVACGALLEYVSRPYRVARIEREANAILVAIVREGETSPYRDQWLEYAIQILHKARELDSMNQRTHVLLGAAYLLQGKPSTAMENYKAAELARRDQKLYTSMGYCYMQMGELELARECLDLALRFQPDFPEALEYLAELDKRKGAQ